MNAQLLLEILCGLICVVIILLVWVILRTQDQFKEIRLCLGTAKNELVDSVEIMSSRHEKVEEWIHNATRTTETLHKGILDILGKSEKMEEQIKGISKKSDIFEEALMCIPSGMDEHTSEIIQSLQKISEQVRDNSAAVNLRENRIEESVNSLSGRLEKIEKSISDRTEVIKSLQACVVRKLITDNYRSK